MWQRTRKKDSHKKLRYIPNYLLNDQPNIDPISNATHFNEKKRNKMNCGQLARRSHLIPFTMDTLEIHTYFFSCLCVDFFRVNESQ